MGNSSLNSLQKVSSLDFSNESFNSTISSIMLDSHKNNQILVEGPEDIEIMGQFFADRARMISAGSKSNVEKVISRVFRRKTNIIGICDRDYGAVGSIPHVFYYDGNNLEMMVIKDDNVFNNPIFINSGFRKDVLISAKEMALNKLLPVSVLRIERENKEYKFSLEDVCPSDDLLLLQDNDTNIYSIKYNLINKSLGYSSAEMSCFVSDYSSRLSNGPIDCYEVTQGHDFIRIFRKVLTNIGEKRLYKFLSSSFTKEFFKQTELFKKIRQYEVTETLSLICF